MSVVYKTIDEFPAYRVGDDGSMWTRWQRKPLGPNGGTKSVLSDTWKPMKACIDKKDGYRCINLYDMNGHMKRFKIGRLVLTTFNRIPLSQEVMCHCNGINTDDRLSNLRWDSVLGNAADRERHGTALHGEKNSQAKLSPESVRQIRQLRADTPVSNIAKRFGVHIATVYKISNGKSWRRS